MSLLSPVDEFHAAGSALLADRKSADAANAFRAALELDPGHAASAALLGVALAELGRLDEALPLLNNAVEQSPNDARARLNLGVALAQAGQPADAARELAEGARLDPRYDAAFLNLGNALRDLGRLDEAVTAYRDAARLRPDLPAAHANLGFALTELGRPDDALPHLRHAARLKPDAKDAHNGLGIALADLGRLDEAVAAYEAALRIEPAAAAVLTNLASADKERDRVAEAIAGYDLALTLDPQSSSARYNRSLALLKAGDYVRGFAEYEWRWRRSRTPSRLFEKPRWDGSPLDGRTVLLWCEQGQGDAVQFVRFAAEAAARGGRVVVECPQPLAGLFATCPGVAAVVPEREPLPPYDVQCPLMSVPAVIGTTLETVPAPVPYLSADSERVAAWRDRLLSLPGRRVGIAWQGNPRHRWDRFRSVPLEAFAPLAALPGVTLVSLQQGPATAQVRQVTNRFAVAELPSAEPPTWEDTAAVLATLDLVVTVDTSVAHVAGALGVPTWVLIGAVSDWRWLVGRGDSPWYPTMRLYRQREIGHWEPVFDRVAADLRRWAEPQPFRHGFRHPPPLEQVSQGN